ncbi:hypothetical protein [Halorhabdus rudnickae]|uniref:hypothetical protein n=1 Tax=Halorhabdus rudnickae TaxID=1775544 RepID=UPI0010830594|nr:hypothetical protein [Halorhabdus rudnickae]
MRNTVTQRVSYYGKYLIQNEDGKWVRNPAYEGTERNRTPYEYVGGADSQEVVDSGANGNPEKSEQAATDGGDPTSDGIDD